MSPIPKPLQPDNPPDRRGSIEEQAADWIARRDRGLLDGEQDALRAWLDADPRHAAAVKSAEGFWRLLLKPRRTGQSEQILREIAARLRARRRRRVALSLSACAAAAIAVLVYSYVPFSSRDGDTPVSIAGMRVKPDRRTLSDGSTVEIDSKAEIAVDFTGTKRSVRLLGGTALFAVAKDPLRPFMVVIGGVTVRAVGTEFCVRTDSEELAILVTEGRVAIDTLTMNSGVAATQTTWVDAGQDASLPADAGSHAPEVRPTSPQTTREALAWRDLRVEFTEMRLGDVVTLFNGRNPLKLDLDAGAADLRISGIFWLDDPEGFARLVTTSAELETTRVSSQMIFLRQQSEKK